MLNSQSGQLTTITAVQIAGPQIVDGFKAETGSIFLTGGGDSAKERPPTDAEGTATKPVKFLSASLPIDMLYVHTHVLRAAHK